MIRKPPLKTYQRKKTAQSSVCYSQSSLWESDRLFSRRISINSDQYKPRIAQDEKSIDNISLDCLETTFDRIAKDVRLPPPPQQESNSTLNVSSDIPQNDPSPIKIDVYEFPCSKEQTKPRANRRAKRKPGSARAVYGETEVVVKKRLKHDLINTSTKKDKAFRSSKRKVANKIDKGINKINAQDFTLNDSIDWFVKSSEGNENRKKPRNRYPLRKKVNDKKILYSSSSNDSNDCGNHDADVNKVKSKTKNKNIARRCRAERKKVEILDSVDTPLEELSDLLKIRVEDGNKVETKDCPINKSRDVIHKESFSADSDPSVNIKRIGTGSNKSQRRTANRNSSARKYVANFRKYSALKSRKNNDEDSPDSKKVNRISNRKQYLLSMSSEITTKNGDQKSTDVSDISKNSERSKDNDHCENDFPNKPSTIGLMNCKSNVNSAPNGKESAIAIQNPNMHSTVDIFQSSISNIEPENHDTMKTKLRQSVSDRNDDSDLSREHNEVEINRESIERKERCRLNRSLHYLKCSTPINARVQINGTINFLSPITSSGDICRKNRNFVDSEVVRRNFVVHGHNREYSDSRKANMRRRSARKKLSVSSEEKESLEKRNEDCEENEMGKALTGSVEKHGEKHSSPTSQIQESLEVLKLNLENSPDKYKKDDKDKRNLSRKEILQTESNGSDKMFDSSNKYEDTNEFIGRSKDTCSQLTPAGIITTRSGRQLKLNRTTQKKFFNDSNDSKIHSDTDNEIINDSEVARNICLRNRITQRRGRRFVALESHAKRNTPDNGRPKIKTDVNGSIAQTPNNITIHESTHLEVLQKLEGRPSRRRSKRLTQNYREESGVGENTEIVGDDPQYTMNSDYAGPENQHTSLSNQEISQSIIESTKNLDSLNIKSPIAVKVENASEDENDSDSEWSTYSDNTNLDSTTSNVEEKTEEKSHGENGLTNLSLNPSEGSTSDRNELKNDASSVALNNTSTLAELPLAERLKLLSTRITTRNRRKTSLKPVAKNTPQKSEERAAMESSVHLELTNSVNAGSKNELYLKEEHEVETKIENETQSLDETNYSEPLTEPLYTNPKTDLQPMVLLERLNDHSRMISLKTADREFRENVINDRSNKALKAIDNSSNDTLAIEPPLIDENDQDFKKSDPLHCPPEKSEADNSLSEGNMAHVSQFSGHFLQPDLNILEEENKNFVLLALQHCLLDKSNRNERNLSSDTIKTLTKRSRKSRSSLKAMITPEMKVNCHAVGLDMSNREAFNRRSVFLKPGKEWARSLSILNNIQNASNLEELSTGKGKKWRESVQTIFAMQQEGLLQSCTGQSENDKDTQTRLGGLDSTSISDTIPRSEEQSVGSASPTRFIRRMSIRVVPDNKRLSKIEDTSFLEAYGITSTKSRKALSPQFELGEETLTCSERSKYKADETVKSERIVTARDVVLQRCGQENYSTFSKCYPAEYLKRCRKIGEGVYGEVFLHEHRTRKSVIKIIPIEGDALVNGERQKKFDEILSEIVIAKELHDLRTGDEYQTHGFVEVKNIRCIKGKYPEKLIELWKAYDNNKGSDNDCPSMFDRNQLYIVLELGHGGEDLEAFVFNSAIDAHALFVQTAVALAVAEQSLEFEHRDLHWGNILIKETNNTEVTYKLNHKEYTYPTRGLEVAIIDFTLSRMSYDGCCIFNDLASDPALFTAQGEYQFEIYRLMQDKVENNWQVFEPYTNILWLHYVLDKMISSLRYKRVYAKVQREGLFLLHQLKEDVLNYKSAFDFVTNCEKITNLQCNTRPETTLETIKIEAHDQE